MQRTSFLKLSAAALAAMQAGPVRVLAAERALRVTHLARADREWLVGAPGRCASSGSPLRGAGRLRAAAIAGYTAADFA